MKKQKQKEKALIKFYDMVDHLTKNEKSYSVDKINAVYNYGKLIARNFSEVKELSKFNNAFEKAYNCILKTNKIHY